jgi:hypothetical protein
MENFISNFLEISRPITFVGLGAYFLAKRWARKNKNLLRMIDVVFITGFGILGSLMFAALFYVVFGLGIMV